MRNPSSSGFPFGARRTWQGAVRPGTWLFDRYFSLSVEGKDLVPEGPVVVAANHFSHLDPVVVAMAVDRPIRYLAVDELFGNSRFFDNLTQWLGAIPMSRTRAPLGALRLACSELGAGGTVGVFPEGVRVWRWGEREPKRGAAWLARRMDVPLVPVAVAGTEEAMGRGPARIRRSPIHVEVCQPILPADSAGNPDSIGAMTDLWRSRIGEVLDTWYGT